MSRVPIQPKLPRDNFLDNSVHNIPRFSNLERLVPWFLPFSEYSSYFLPGFFRIGFRFSFGLFLDNEVVSRRAQAQPFSRPKKTLPPSTFKRLQGFDCGEGGFNFAADWTFSWCQGGPFGRQPPRRHRVPQDPPRRRPPHRRPTRAPSPPALASPNILHPPPFVPTAILICWRRFVIVIERGGGGYHDCTPEPPK